MSIKKSGWKYNNTHADAFVSAWKDHKQPHREYLVLSHSKMHRKNKM